MSLFDLSFSSYSINENKKPFEENDADSDEESQEEETEIESETQDIF